MSDWIEPEVDWDIEKEPQPADLNRIENDLKHLKEGNTEFSGDKSFSGNNTFSGDNIFSCNGIQWAIKELTGLLNAFGIATVITGISRANILMFHGSINPGTNVDIPITQLVGADISNKEFYVNSSGNIYINLTPVYSLDSYKIAIIYKI